MRAITFVLAVIFAVGGVAAAQDGPSSLSGGIAGVGLGMMAAYFLLAFRK
jgi:hypothetical protein